MLTLSKLPVGIQGWEGTEPTWGKAVIWGLFTIHTSGKVARAFDNH
jgi:hypothetical protein